MAGRLSPLAIDIYRSPSWTYLMAAPQKKPASPKKEKKQWKPMEAIVTFVMVLV